MREETRPEGSDAVDSVTVSGTVLLREGEVNHVWNWTKGLVSRCERRRVEWVN